MDRPHVTPIDGGLRPAITFDFMIRVTAWMSLFLAADIAPPAAAQSDLRYFVGTWDFRAWSGTDTEGTPDITATWILENGLDSALALTGHVVIAGVTFTRELITFDPYADTFTRTITANNGGHFVFTSTGWVGDGLVWLGTQRTTEGILELKEEIKRTGPDSFRAVFFRRMGGTWEPQQTELLARVRGR